jgi:hypothetical protein
MEPVFPTYTLVGSRKAFKQLLSAAVSEQLGRYLISGAEQRPIRHVAR